MTRATIQHPSPTPSPIRLPRFNDSTRQRQIPRPANFRSLLLIAAILIASQIARADNVELVSQMVGMEYGAMAAQGDLAFIKEGPYLTILDVSDLARPRPVSRTPLVVNGVAIEGFLVYVLTGAGLQIVDASNPAAPVLLGACNTPAAPGAIAVVNSMVYAACGGAGLQIIDASDPTAPFLQGAYRTRGSALDVVVSSTLAYIADFDSALKIVDVSNPAAPALVGAYDLWGATRVAITGSLVCLKGYETLHVLDVSSPSAPALWGTLDLDCTGAPDIAASGTLLYTLETYVCTKNYGYLEIYDISRPGAPARRGSHHFATAPTDVAMCGSLVYVGLNYWWYPSQGGFRIFDASNPGQPILRGAYDPPRSAIDIAVSGSRVCLADNSQGMKLIDASDPTRPVFEGAIQAYSFEAYDVALSGTLACLGGENPYGDSYTFEIYDVSTPVEPVRRYFDGYFLTNGIAIDGSLVCVASPIFEGENDYDYNEYRGVRLVDVSEPTTPTQQGTYYMTVAPLDVALDGSLLCIAKGLASLDIVDVSDPTSPALRGAIETSGTVNSVALSHRLAFLATGERGLQIVDVSDPDAPFLRGAVDTPGAANDIAVSGTLAYIADGDAGVQVIDVSDPDAPIIVGSYDTPGNANAVAVGDGLCYVADGAGGLIILRYVPPTELASWGFAAPGGDLTAPNADAVSGSLRLETTSNSAEFGFWGSSPTAAPIVADAFHRTAWTVSSNITPPAMVPSMRLRVNASNGQQANYLIVDSTDDGRFSPDADGETYELYFDSPTSIANSGGRTFLSAAMNDAYVDSFDETDGGVESPAMADRNVRPPFPSPLLTPLLAEPVVYWQFAFDLTNFGANDAAAGWIALDSFAYERLARPTTATVVQRHGFSHGEEGWTFMPPIAGFNLPIGLLMFGAIGMQATTNSMLFGSWSSPANDALLSDSEPLTRVVFRVGADEPNATLIPTLRLRLNLSIGHVASVLQIDSAGAAANSPTFAGRDYSLYYLAPPTAFGEGVTLSFDMLNFDATNSPSARLYLDDVRVETMSRP